MGRDPIARRPVGQVLRRESFRVDFPLDLQRVTPVDEDRGFFGEHDRESGRAGKAGQPREAARPRRHELSLMLVRQRHDETVQPAPG